MPDDLYDRDVLVWSEQQAELLRRLAHGERVNETVDWPHVIEEIEDVGRSELSACQNLLRQALVHLLKLRLGADHPAAHWRGEVAGFLADAQSRFSPSMRQRIELEILYAKALRQVRASAEDAAVDTLPRTCPVTLDELLSEKLDVGALETRFAEAA